MSPLSQLIKEERFRFNKLFLYCAGRPMKGSLTLTHNNVRDFMDSSTKALLTGIIEGMREKQKVHTHNSIPNLYDYLDEGCVVCVKNAALQSMIDELSEVLKEIK